MPVVSADLKIQSMSVKSTASGGSIVSLTQLVIQNDNDDDARIVQLIVTLPPTSHMVANLGGGTPGPSFADPSTPWPTIGSVSFGLGTMGVGQTTSVWVKQRCSPQKQRRAQAWERSSSALCPIRTPPTTSARRLFRRAEAAISGKGDACRTMVSGRPVERRLTALSPANVLVGAQARFPVSTMCSAPSHPMVTPRSRTSWRHHRSTRSPSMALFCASPWTISSLDPRQPRKVFGNPRLRDLTNDIRRIGLLVAPTGRQHPLKAWQLVAGERRFRALSYLYHG